MKRDTLTGQIFAVWVDDQGEGKLSVRWSRANELYAVWRKPSSIAHRHGDVFSPEIQFAKDRLLLTYLTAATRRGEVRKTGDAVLHWKNVQGGPWSEGVLVRRAIHPPPEPPNFPYHYEVDRAADQDGRVWALVVCERFVEPTYALYPTSAPERAISAPNPWEDDHIYTGVLAHPSDKPSLIWENGNWHIIRRAFDDRKDAYRLEALSLDLSILRHDHNEDGQTDVVDALLSQGDSSRFYTLWAESDLPQLVKDVGTLVAVRAPDQRSGRVDPTARVVFETSTALAHTSALGSRSNRAELEIVGRGQQFPITSIRQASSASGTASQYHQRRPASVTFAIDAPYETDRSWLAQGMIVAERGIFTNSTTLQCSIEWRVSPCAEGWTGHAHVLGSSYPCEVSGIEKVATPSRHRTATWVGKRNTHTAWIRLREAIPATNGMRFALIHFEDETRYTVVGIARIIAIT